MKTKKYRTVETVLKFNKEIVLRGKFDTPNTKIWPLTFHRYKKKIISFHFMDVDNPVYSWSLNNVIIIKFTI
jgi:hypothetical protein